MFAPEVMVDRPALRVHSCRVRERPRPYICSKRLRSARTSSRCRGRSDHELATRRNTIGRYWGRRLLHSRVRTRHRRPSAHNHRRSRRRDVMVRRRWRCWTCPAMHPGIRRLTWRYEARANSCPCPCSWVWGDRWLHSRLRTMVWRG